MHRRPLLSMLQRYRQAWPGEADVANRIEALVESHPDCFERSCRPGHITGSAWVVSADREKFLLVHHRKLGRWLQPGGHADGDPDVLAVALREACEESGLTSLAWHSSDGEPAEPTPLDVDVHQIPERRSPTGELLDDVHQHHDLRFLLVAEGDEALVVSDESHDVRWFTASEVRDLVSEESVLRLLRKSETLLRASDEAD